MSTRKEPSPEQGKADPAAAASARRVQVRRRGMAFSGGGVSRSSAGGTPVAEDPNDDHPDLRPDLNAEVARRALSAPAQQEDPMADAADAGLQSISNQGDFTPQSRLAQVGRRSSEYEREYRLSLLSRLLMRKIPLDEIAQQLNISLSQVNRDKAELASRMRDAARSLNIEEMVGSNMEFYDEVMAMAMRAASNSNSPLPMRLAAMRTALASRNDQHRFLQAAGVYDTLRFRRAPGGNGQSDIQKMLAAVDDLMSEDRAAARQASTENPLGEFSGGDTERVEL